GAGSISRRSGRRIRAGTLHPSRRSSVMTPIYTAVATVKGGRGGHAETEDGKLKVDLALPKELGGDGNGTNPEQLFAAGYGACFGGALDLVARQQNTPLK